MRHARSTMRNGRALSISLSAVLAIGISADSGQAQSFNCRRATHADEVLICQDARLSALDEQLASLYSRQRQRLAREQRAALERDQGAWLRRRRQCGRDPACITDLYQARIRELTVQAVLPAAIGECVTTAIARIGDRFGARLPETSGADTTGTAVSFSNGGYQVSYDWEAAIARSRVGDRVRMCLVSIPKDCPPGDNRGREYTTTNLRTGEAWTLPDAQHMCGGA